PRLPRRPRRIRRRAGDRRDLGGRHADARQVPARAGRSRSRGRTRREPDRRRGPGPVELVARALRVREPRCRTARHDGRMMRRRMLSRIVVSTAMTASLLLAGSPAFAASTVPAVIAPTVDETPTPDPTSPVPDDPSDPVRAKEYWLDGARIRDAWQVTRGKGVTIAVIDTGVGKPPVTFDGAVTGGTDVSGSGTADGRTPVGVRDPNH